MTYLDSGFNQYFQRELIPSYSNGDSSNQTPYDRETSSEGFSADQITGGQLRSPSGNLVVDLTNDTFSIASNGAELVRFGQINDDLGAGLQIKNRDGKVLMQICDKGNFIQGPSENLLVDLDEDQLLIKDNGLPQVLLGRHVGGFV